MTSRERLLIICFVALAASFVLVVISQCNL